MKRLLLPVTTLPQQGSTCAQNSLACRTALSIAAGRCTASARVRRSVAAGLWWEASCSDALISAATAAAATWQAALGSAVADGSRPSPAIVAAQRQRWP